MVLLLFAIKLIPIKHYFTELIKNNVCAALRKPTKRRNLLIIICAGRSREKNLLIKGQTVTIKEIQVFLIGNYFIFGGSELISI